jgi:hypothetical protein
LALDVYQGKDVEAQKVIVWKKHNGANQRWRVVYVDKSKKEATSGFSKEWGFYINRPLYFRSRLPMQRIAELVGTDVRLRRYHVSRKRQQTWKFDITSKTLKSMYHTGHSMDITNSGRSANLRSTTTNSRWW